MESACGCRLTRLAYGSWPSPCHCKRYTLAMCKASPGLAVARYDVDRQIVPGGGSAGGHDPSALIGKNDIRVRNEVHLREASTKQIGITPVACRRFAVEQAGCRQQHRAGAG